MKFPTSVSIGFSNIVSVLKSITSACLTILSLVVIIYGIINHYNTIPLGHYVLEIFLLLLLLLLLAANEGFQVGAICIEHMVEESISNLGYSRTALIHNCLFSKTRKNANGIRGLFVGQSFLVVFCSFMIARLTTFQTFPNNNMNNVFVAIFLRSGLPGVFFTVNIAQLLPSLLAKKYPLQFLNLPGIYWIIMLALNIESVGIFQFLYLYVGAIERLCCVERNSKKSIPSSSHKEYDSLQSAADNETRLVQESQTDQNTSSHTGRVFDQALLIVKYAMSTVLTLLSLCFIIYSLSQGYSSFQSSIVSQFIILFVALIIIFYCEGIDCLYVCIDYISIIFFIIFLILYFLTGLKIAIVGTADRINYSSDSSSSLSCTTCHFHTIHAILSQRARGVERY